MHEAIVRVQIYAATADAAFAEKIALALHRRGVLIVNGPFDPRMSDAVVAVWSPAALRSRKLLDAAQAPLAEGALVPVSLGRVPPPDGFEGLEPANLAGWEGDDNDPRWRFVLEELAAVAARRQVDATGHEDESETLAAPDADERSALPAEAWRSSLSRPRAPPQGEQRRRALLVGFAAVGAAIAGGFAALLAMREGAAPADQQAPPPQAETPAAATTPPVYSSADDFHPPVLAIVEPVDEAEDEKPAASDGERASALDPDSLTRLIKETAADGPPGRVAGEIFRDCDLCPEMTTIPAGSFAMGSPAGERSRQRTEGPAKEVAIARPFALGVREVTFEEWAACASDGGCAGRRPEDHGWGRGRRPVIDVSWRDAAAYAQWLSEKTGETYRLPSEAEWEYAARAGAQTPFSFGESVAPSQANFDGSLAYGAARGVNRRRPVEVGSFEANGFGLFDMHGNVWEWVADCWSPSHEGRPDDGSARGGACDRRVLKGGAWNSGGWRLRAGHRIGKNEAAREYDNGFRVLRELD